MIPGELCNVTVIEEGHNKPQKGWEYMIPNADVDFKGYYCICGHRKSLISLMVRAYLPIVTIFQFYISTTDGEIL